MRSIVFKSLPWLILLAIVVATLSPIQFRPRSYAPAQSERFFAFALLGLTFVVGYARQWLPILIGLLAVALCLELGQLLTPDRHWGVADLLAKSTGAIIGTMIGLALRRFAPSRRRQRS